MDLQIEDLDEVGRILSTEIVIDESMWKDVDEVLDYIEVNKMKIENFVDYDFGDFLSELDDELPALEISVREVKEVTSIKFSIE